uniref:Uncharacterized protein n=1 Tax=uncultured bacterium BAC10G6 TaxID=1329522 RepID=R4JC25_9BACT|nr:hypothetical protein metaSSY_00400 [uncultured bacterium BAC10G6]
MFATRNRFVATKIMRFICMKPRQKVENKRKNAEIWVLYAVERCKYLEI